MSRARTDTLLVIDETHTQFAVYGGGTHDFGLTPDIVTGGKGIGGGAGRRVRMTDPLSDYLADNLEGDFAGQAWCSHRWNGLRERVVDGRREGRALARVHP